MAGKGSAARLTQRAAGAFRLPRQIKSAWPTVTVSDHERDLVLPRLKPGRVVQPLTFFGQVRTRLTNLQAE